VSADKQDDFDVVGEASDADTALAPVGALHPDIVLMDFDMPGDDLPEPRT
jgi:DNA-binding NarL/FixJ family response regulator